MISNTVPLVRVKYADLYPSVFLENLPYQYIHKSNISLNNLIVSNNTFNLIDNNNTTKFINNLIDNNNNILIDNKDENEQINSINLQNIFLHAEESQEQINLFTKWTNYLLKEEENKNKETNEQILNNVWKEYKEKFHQKQYGSRYFDLHGFYFQNFAVTLTNLMLNNNENDNKENNRLKVRSLSYAKDHACKRILRARVYAISSREDIDWNGNFLNSDKEKLEKKKSLIEYLNSLVLYDWFNEKLQVNNHLMNTNDNNEKNKEEEEEIKVRVIRQGTQETVEQIYKELNEDSTKLIAWVNFANAHNVCGSYSVDFGGSQEEEVATNCNGAALLGTVGELIRTGVKSFVRGVWVAYKKGFHIPPGGNYFCKTKFITGTKHLDCGMIAAAFADFRYYIPFFTPFCERNYFYSFLGLGSSVKDEREMEDRLRLDIEGVLKTCVEQKVHTLVTGASGCGAFLHDPYREAKLWAECLKKEEYKGGHLKQVIFSILDKEDSHNIIAFTNQFETKL
ncbi:hypothetical protein ABK040_012583 [Willaertia magna]